MHPNTAFRQESHERALAFARARGFGVMTVPGTQEILASHIPFIIEDGCLRAHLVRSNPMARALQDGALQALFVVQGPDAYISPDWYGIDDQVPTWNYVAVHLRGALALAAPETLGGLLDALSARFEAELRPKSPWTAAKVTPAVLARMMRMLVPVSMRIDHVASTFKLSQNKPDSVRQAAAGALRPEFPGHEIEALAALMHAVPETDV